MRSIKSSLRDHLNRFGKHLVNRKLLLVLIPLLVLLSGAGALKVSGQTIDANLPVPTLEVENGPMQFRVRINNGSSVCNGTLRVALPAGFLYVPGTVAIGGVLVDNVNTEGNSFSIPVSTSGGGSGFHEVTYSVQADCSANNTAVSQRVVNYTLTGCGTTQSATSNVINLEAASLQITVTPSISIGLVGDEIIRTITVTNSGNGDIKPIYIKPEYGLGIERVEHSVLEHLSFVDGLYVYDELLPSGASITFTEKVKVIGCSGLNSTYLSYFGPEDQQCNINDNRMASTSLVIDVSQRPRLTITDRSTADQTICLGGTYSHSWRLSNTGNAPASAIELNIPGSISAINVSPAVGVSITGQQITFDEPILPGQYRDITFTQTYISAATGTDCTQFPNSYTTEAATYTLTYAHIEGCTDGQTPAYSTAGTTKQSITLAFVGESLGDTDIISGQSYMADFRINQWSFPEDGLTSDASLDIVIDLLSGDLSVPDVNNIRLFNGATYLAPELYAISTTGTSYTIRINRAGLAHIAEGSWRLSFPLALRCPMEDANALSYRISANLNTCNGIVPFGCETETLRGRCDGGDCAEGGMSRSDASLTRVTLGYADGNNDAKPDDPITTASSNLSIRTFVAGDTVEITQGGVVLAPAIDPDHVWANGGGFRVTVQNANFAMQAVLNSGKVTITRAGGAPISFDGLEVMGSGTEFSINLPMSDGTFTGFETDDQVEVSLQLKALDPNALQGRKIFNTDYWLNDQDNVPRSCGLDYAASGYYGRTTLTASGSTYNLPGCESGEEGAAFTLNYSVGGNTQHNSLFPNEFRQLAKPKTITFDVDDNLELIGYRLELLGNRATMSGLTVTLAASVSNGSYTIDETTLSNEIDQLKTAANGLAIDEGFSFRAKPIVRPKCDATNEAIIRVSATMDGTFHFAGISHLEQTDVTIPEQELKYSTDNDKFQVNVIQASTLAYSREVTWIMSVRNRSEFRTMGNIWLGQEESSADVSLSRVRKIASLVDTATVDNYDVSNTQIEDIYELGELAPGETQYYMVYATLSDCVENGNIQIAYGKDCSGYPTNVASALCSEIYTEELSFELVDPILQTYVLDDPGANQLPICEPIEYVVEINNAGGEATEMALTIDIVSWLEYISESAPDDFVAYMSDVFRSRQEDKDAIDFDTVIENVAVDPEKATITIPASALPSERLKNGERFYLKFELKVVNCEFVAGQTVTLTPSAENFCGIPVDQETRIIEAGTQRIILEGAPTEEPVLALDGGISLNLTPAGAGERLTASYNASISNIGNGTVGAPVLGTQGNPGFVYKYALKLPENWEITDPQSLVDPNKLTYINSYPDTGYVYAFNENLEFGDQIQLTGQLQFNVPLDGDNCDVLVFADITQEVYTNFTPIGDCVGTAPFIGCDGMKLLIEDHIVPFDLTQFSPRGESRQVFCEDGIPTLDEIATGLSSTGILEWYNEDPSVNAGATVIDPALPVVSGTTYYAVNRLVEDVDCWSPALAILVLIDTEPVAEAGPEQLKYNNRDFTMAGNAPDPISNPDQPSTGVREGSEGEWSFVSGSYLTGGDAVSATSVAIANPTSFNTTVRIPLGSTVTLRWTVTNECGEDTDEVVITSRIAALQLEKIAHDVSDVNNDGRHSAGDIISYSFVIRNTGQSNMRAPITITDARLGWTNHVVSTVDLAPGNILNLPEIVDYTVSQTDMNAGVVPNTAFASGSTPEGIDETNTAIPGFVVDSEEDVANRPLTQRPEISFVKSISDFDGTERVGDAITYRFTVTNTGNVTVDNLRLFDAKLNLNNAIGLSPASIAPGQIATYTKQSPYIITQADMDRGYVENSATVRGTTLTAGPIAKISDTGTNREGAEITDPGTVDSDGDGVPDNDPTLVDLNQNPAITFTKVGDYEGNATVPVVGDGISYTFVVRNTGNLTIRNVSVQEVMFSGTGFPHPVVSLSNASAGSSAGVLLPGGVLTYTATYAITYQDMINQKVDNQARVSGVLPDGSPIGKLSDDPRTPDVDDPTTVPLPPIADLSIVKVSNSTVYTPGRNVTYTITVTNNGPSDVVGARVIDNLPNGLSGTWTAVLSGGAFGNTSSVGAVTAINETVNLPAQSRIVYTLEVAIPSNFAVANADANGVYPNLVNTARVEAPAAGPDIPTDPFLNNNSSTVTNTPAVIADMYITKDATEATYTPGTSATYTVIVGNNGPSDVEYALVEDHLPAGTTGSWEVTDVSGAAHTSAAVGTTGNGHLKQQVNMISGGWVEYTVTVNVPSDFTGELVNHATITPPSGTLDPVLDNNVDGDSNTPTPRADLSIEKTNSSNTYTPGAATTYTITVKNNGPSNVIGATVRDQLPTNTTGTWTATFVGGASGMVSGTGDLEEVVHIPNGGSIVYTVVVNVPSNFTGDLANTATVTPPAGVIDPGYDPNATDPFGTGNNTSTTTNTPAPIADLAIVKTDNASTYTPGESVVYTITVTNNGPSDVVGATVTDDFSVAGLEGTWTVVSQTNASGATASSDSEGAMSQTVSIQNGGSIVYQVTVAIPADFTGNLINTATVALPTGGTNDPTDPNPDNNISTDENTLAAVADLALTKIANTATPKVDEVVTFTLTVTNNGPSDAANVRVTDQLPNGYAFVSATPSIGTYAPTTGVWTVGALANTTSATLTIQARVRSTGDYRNRATATSDAEDRDLTDNTAEAKPSVIAAFDDQLGTFVSHTGGTTTGHVLSNDLLNGALAISGTGSGHVILTWNPGSIAIPAGITLNPNGTITVAPGTPADTYRIPYRITEVGNATNFDDAFATVVVTATPIQALDNTYGPVRGAEGKSDLGNVLDNDRFNGGPLETDDITNNVIELTVVNVAAPQPDAPAGNTNVPVLNAATGVVSVPANTPDGTYTIVYRICEVINPSNCSTAEVRVTVGDSNIDALDDNYIATPINGADGSTLPSVILNDLLNGTTLTEENVTGANPLITLTPGNSPLPGQITMNPDGSITVDPGTPEGVYAYTYRICEVLNPTRCDDAIATFKVIAPTIVAVQDNYASNSANDIIGKVGGSLPSVILNDKLNDETLTMDDIDDKVTLTPGTSPHPHITMNADGTINVVPNTPAAVYRYPYTICEVLNPNNCANTVAIINVTASTIEANDDFTPSVEIDGLSGGRTTASVLDNDNLNGIILNSNDPQNSGFRGLVELTPGAPTHSGLTMNPDGTISVAPGTPASTYTYPYTICEVLNPTNCSSATATIIVLAPEIEANDDNYGPVNGATGSNNVGNALANDRLNGVNATLDKVTITTDPANDTFTANPGTIPASPASGTRPVLDPNTGVVRVPAGTPGGEYKISYRITDRLNPTTNFDNATITVTVVEATIVARPDQYGPVSTADGNPNLGNILENDHLNGQPVTVTVGTTPGNVTLTVDVTNITVGGATPPAGSLVPEVSAEGVVSVPVGTPAGTYEIPYTICEVLNPTNCSSTTIKVVVQPTPIQALDNTYGPVKGNTAHPNLGNVLGNDTFNGNPLATGDIDDKITLTVVDVAVPQPDAPAGNTNVPVLDATTGQVSVPANTPDGTYIITYRICEVINPSNCSTAEVRVTVGDSNIDVLDDNYIDTPINGANGATLSSVILNDLLDGATLTVDNVTGANPLITLTPGNSPLPGQITMNPDGTITVAPGTPEGVYAYAYRICEVLNPNSCDDAIATLKVIAPSIVAVIDDYASDNTNDINGKDGGDLTSVILNDQLNGNPLTVADIRLPGTTSGTVTLTPGTPPHAGLTMNPDGTIKVEPNTPAAVYRYPYTICEVLNPNNCANTVAIINVTAALIEADDDFAPAVSVNGATGGRTPSVLINDHLNGAPVVPGQVTLRPGVPSHPGLTMNGDGTISVIPGTPAGTYTYTYTICEVLNPTNCDEATATVTVLPPTIEANDDNYGSINGATGSTNVGNALANDKLNGRTATIDKVRIETLNPATPLVGAVNNNVPTLDEATGIVRVPAGTPAGTYTIRYRIVDLMNDPDNFDDATITITVLEAAILARPDHYGPVSTANGHPNLGNILVNDELNGQQARVTVGASIGNVILTVDINNITVDGATPLAGSLLPQVSAEGVVSVPAGTPAGTYTIPYTICEVLNPTNCSSTTATVIVSATPIVAINDHYGPSTGLVAREFGNALSNDLFNNQAALPAFNSGKITFGTVIPATPLAGAVNNNVPVLNTSTGVVSIPAKTPAGTYVITYEIYELADPNNRATATITVEIIPTLIDPDDDFFSNIDGINGRANVGNVLTNDKLDRKKLNPDDVTITVLEVATSLPGAINTIVPQLDPATGMVSVPAGTPAGEYAIHYQICEILNPDNCDWATAYIEVRFPTIEATNDVWGPINSVEGNANVGNVLTNDSFHGTKPANIEQVVITVLDPATALQDAPAGSPIPSLNPATGVVSVPATTPAGRYYIHYRICDRINPSNCDDATITIDVFKPGITATNDSYTAPVGMVGSPDLGNVLSNDSYNGVTGAPLADVQIVVRVPAVSNPNAVNNNVPQLDPATGTVSVPAGTPAGTYQIQYRIVDKLNPNNFSDAVVTVTVPAAEIVANEDFTPEERINGYDGGTTVTVLDNDLLNNAGLKPTDIGATITLTPDMDGPYPGKLTFNTDGTITVAPQTEAGTYRWWYTICEVLNPGNCARAVATVIVEPGLIEAIDDQFTHTIERFGFTTESVLDNDALNGARVIPSEVILTPGIPSDRALTMNPDGTINVPQGTKVGTYTYPYTICEVLNPNNCSSAVATIVIDAVDIRIPNVFTPNGDGRNDVFEIVGIEAYDRIDLVIINRWGNEVYRSEDYQNEWDGRGLNEGTYFYLITTHRGTTTAVHKGHVLIKSR